MIQVLATIETKPGLRESFLAEFRRVASLVRAEKGCLEYGPAIDVDTGLSQQTPMRENITVIIEKWENLEALHAHLRAEHMLEYRQRVKEAVVSVVLQVLQSV